MLCFDCVRFIKLPPPPPPHLEWKPGYMSTRRKRGGPSAPPLVRQRPLGTKSRWGGGRGVAYSQVFSSWVVCSPRANREREKGGI